MSSPNRNLAAGIPDEPLRFLDGPDYDEAFGPRDMVHRQKTFFPLWTSRLGHIPGWDYGKPDLPDNDSPET